MKVAYITNYDSSDVAHWSGLGYYIRKSLHDQGVEIIPINCYVAPNKITLLLYKINKFFYHKQYEVERHPGYLKKLAVKAEHSLAGKEFDIVLTPSSLLLTYLTCAKPMVFWTDATYDSLIDFYHSANDLTTQSKVHGNDAEQKSINKAALIFYSSKWAMYSAIRKYKANPNKVKQLAFGANIEHETSIGYINQLIEKRWQRKNEIKLLFVGVDWKRKGGDIALQTVLELRRKGYNVFLDIVGCKVPNWIKEISFVRVTPFISKQTEGGVKLLNQYYEDATFFILPSRAECFGVVLAEANSYGLPVITTNVGGLTTAVRYGYSGYCLSLKNFHLIATEKIIRLLNKEEKYKLMSRNAFSYYLKERNWKVIGKKAVCEMKKVLQSSTV